MCDTFHMCDLCFLRHKLTSLLLILFVKMQYSKIGNGLQVIYSTYDFCWQQPDTQTK